MKKALQNKFDLHLKIRMNIYLLFLSYVEISTNRRQIYLDNLSVKFFTELLPAFINEKRAKVNEGFDELRWEKWRLALF